MIIGSMEFPSKKAAKDYCRFIRDQHRTGETVSPEFYEFLFKLMEIHPEAETKIGTGITHFTVEVDKVFRTTRHFMIHRKDGTSTDVSFNSAIDGRNNRNDKLCALRYAIHPQIVEFKDALFSQEVDYTCPLRGVPITPEAYHVDHVPPCTFIQLVSDWLEDALMSLVDVEITPPMDNQYVTEMTNKSQKDSWKQFHKENAKLRLLSPLGNLSDSRRS